MKFWRGLTYFILFSLTFIVWTYHRGVYRKPILAAEQSPGVPGVWLGREKFKLNHLILQGSPYWRGLESGRLTRHLLEAQENELVGQLEEWFPPNGILQSFVLLNILWFQGVENYLEPWMTEEMYGVSKSAPVKYDYLVDGFTRQVAYHGLHEIGQMAVDGGFDAMGCTVAAIPWKNQWVVGRNFDFEGGRIFDREKIVKWVFPDNGHAFVSVIWAGMVGAVTGVNDQGLYLSLNAGGSSDFARLGTPSTLVLTKVLQSAGSAAEALEILRHEKMFITDIFVLLDSKAGKLYRIEKSPDRMAVIALEKASIVTNHLIDPVWQDDATNNSRKQNLTSVQRADRGQQLVDFFAQRNESSTQALEKDVLSILRDKGELQGRPLHLGNRGAIDALIATHAVIYNSDEQVLFVSEGPGVAGPLQGYDLPKSFAQKMPVEVRQLGSDTQVSPELYEKFKTSEKILAKAQSILHAKFKADKCAQAFNLIHQAEVLFKEQSYYYEVLGDAYACQRDQTLARGAWQKSLDLFPPYSKTRQRLQELLKK